MELWRMAYHRLIRQLERAREIQREIQRELERARGSQRKLEGAKVSQREQERRYRAIYTTCLGMLGTIQGVMVISPYPPQLQEELKDSCVLDKDNNWSCGGQGVMTITSGMVPNMIFCHFEQLLFYTFSCIMLSLSRTQGSLCSSWSC